MAIRPRHHRDDPKSKKTGCPDLVVPCTARVTPEFFKNVCMSENGKHRCFYFCKRHEMVMTPVEWLRRLAVLEETPSWDRRSLEERYAIKR